MKRMGKYGLAVLAAGLAAAAWGSTEVSRRTAVVEAVEKVLPSVVNIGTERLVKVRYSDPFRRFRGDLFDQFFSDFFSQSLSPGYRVTHSLGSGVIVDPGGYILTNYHVIERASKIKVTLSDETEYDALLLAGDELNDLALIKIDPVNPLRAVDFGEDDDLLLGETVIALGNPFGLSHTVTVGVLSAKNREARYGGQVLFRDILQTDAAVNPGSSGGPLLNIAGEMIGVNVAIYQEAQNIGFAVPVKRARALLSRWLSPRFIEETWPAFEAESREGRVTVARVDRRVYPEDGPVRKGDVIAAVGDRPVRDVLDFNRALLAYRVGDEVPLMIERLGEVAKVIVPMRELPKPSGEELSRSLLGLVLGAPATPPDASRSGLGKGLPVAEVIEGGPAAERGLRPGLLVTRINDYAIAGPDDVGKALQNVAAGDKVLLGLLSIEESGPMLVAQSTLVEVTAQGP